MAKVNVTIHGEEDVSTAAQKVRSSLHDLKDKAKEATAPFKDFADTIRTVAGLGGAAVVLRQIYGEMSQMEAAFAKLHPELATMNGSLQQWQATTGTVQSAIGGLITAGISPLRGALIGLLEPWAKNIQASADFAIMLGRLNDMGGKGTDLANRLAAAETRKTELLAAQAMQRLTESNPLQLSTFARGATSSSFITDYTKSLEELDKEIAALTAQLKSDTSKAKTLLAPPPAPDETRGLSPVRAAQPMAQDLSNLDFGLAAGLRLLASPGGNGAFWALNAPLQNMIPEGFEDPVVYAQMMAGALAKALPSAFAMGQFADIRRVDAAMGEYTPPPPPPPTLLERTGAGLADIWSGGTTGKMIGGGQDANGNPIKGDPLGALADSISPLLASFGSLQALLDPIGTILKATFDALRPLIDSLLTPLVGILTIIGQTLAATIAPLLQFLAPVIDFIGRAFVWLYNNAIVPVGNVLITLYTAFKGLATLIFYIFTLQWGKIARGEIDFRPAEGDLLKPITTGDLTAAGVASTGTGGYGGSSTNVVKPPDIYVTITVEGSVYGAGGPVEVGREMVHAIEEYIGTGARVTFLEAGA